MSIDQCEQSVVLAQANIGARVECRATLTNNDGTCGNQFAAVGFDA